jgi:hypothetical protein
MPAGIGTFVVVALRAPGAVDGRTTTPAVTTGSGVAKA